MAIMATCRWPIFVIVRHAYRENREKFFAEVECDKKNLSLKEEKKPKTKLGYLEILLEIMQSSQQCI